MRLKFLGVSIALMTVWCLTAPSTAAAEGPRRLLLAAPAGGGQNKDAKRDWIRLRAGVFFPVNEADGSNPDTGFGLGVDFPFGFNDCGNFLFSLTYGCFKQDGGSGYPGGGGSGGGNGGGEGEYQPLLASKSRAFGINIPAGMVELIYPMIGYHFNVGDSGFYAGPSIGGAIAHNDNGGSDFSFAYALTGGYNLNRFFIEARYLRGAAATQSGFLVTGGIRF